MKTLLTPKSRKLIKKLIAVFLPIFSVIFLILTTTIIIVVMKGYSIDINKKELIKTGVLNIETHPINVSITVNGKYYGDTNKAIPNLKIGKYYVKLSKEGYFDYVRNIEVLHGIASPIIVPLIKDIASEEVIKAENLSNAIIRDDGSDFYIIREKSVENAKIRYSLDKVTTSKTFFDDPKPEKENGLLSLITFESTPIVDLSVSPTGTSAMVITQDKESKTKYVSIIPITSTSDTVNLDLSKNKILTHYINDKDTSIKWARDADYILIDTRAQIVSYNITSGTRIILLEKTSENVIWTETETGIVVLREPSITDAILYEITDTSFNGNPLELSLTLSSEEISSSPLKIWSYSLDDSNKLLVINTKKGAYVLGRLFNNKQDEYSISSSTEDIDGHKITHLNSNVSMIQISDTQLSTQPIFLPESYSYVFTENDNKTIVKFTYNKRAADELTTLGRENLLESEETISDLIVVAGEAYIAYKQDNNLYLTDIYGENIYLISKDIKVALFSQNNTAILETNGTGSISFRVLR